MKGITAQQVLEALAKTYDSDAYAFLSQLRNGTGYDKSARTADAIAMCLWPSRGLEIEGYEIKVSKSDWKTELADPSKADEFHKYCDRWWLITPKDLVDVKELPIGWGLKEYDGAKIRVKVQAERNKAIAPDRLLLGSILRNFCKNTVARDAIKSLLNVEFEKGEKHALSDRSYQELENAKLREKVQLFEKETGLSFDDWKYDAKKLGIAVRQVLEGRHVAAKEKLLDLKAKAENIAKYIEGQEIETWTL
jgi:hypothetical protein